MDKETIIKRVLKMKNLPKREEILHTLGFTPTLHEPGVQSFDGTMGTHYREEGTHEIYSGQNKILLDQHTSSLIGLSPNIIMMGRSLFLGAESIDKLSIQGKYINPYVFGSPGNVSPSTLFPKEIFKIPGTTFVMGGACRCPYHDSPQVEMGLEDLFELQSPFLPSVFEDTTDKYLKELKRVLSQI